MVLRSKPKHILEVTPIFNIWTLLMGFAFMYSFTLEKQAEVFFGAIEIFRWLYVIGLLLLARGVILKEDLEVTRAEFLNIFMWSMVALMGVALANISIAAFTRAGGAMSIWDLTINTLVVDDILITFLAGYNEEVAFCAIYYLIFRLAPDRDIRLGRFSVNFAHLLTLWAVALLFPIFHSIAYNIWGPAFVVLFIGRMVLTEVMVRSKRIEPSILAHTAWDFILVIPALFVGG